ncbi:MAG: AMP-binding protein [Saezia sp.]
MKKASMPFRAGGSSTLAKALDYAAQSAAGVGFWGEDGELITQCSYEGVRKQALKLALYLKTLDFVRGGYVAMIAETRLEFHILFFACQYAGLIPCPLPFTILPAGRQAYEDKLIQLTQVLKPTLFVAPKSIEAIALTVGQACRTTVTSYEALIESSSYYVVTEYEGFEPLSEEEDAYVQFSSGSTAQPKGLVITQKGVMANLNVLAKEGLGVVADDEIFSWIPFDHNMGLAGYILSTINTQTTANYLSPLAFRKKPELWLELMSKCRTRTTFAPEFAYALALQQLDPNKKLDLSALRSAGIAGDMIHAETLREFARKMASSGFKFEVFGPAYGLAEATLAVAMTRSGEPPFFIKQYVDEVHTQELVSCGKVMPGFEVSIKNASKSISMAYAVGEVWVKGPSLVTKTLVPSNKIEMDEDGFIPTGDLGFLCEGHLFISGRVKDMIIIRGRNIWAQDVEWVVAGCDERVGERDVVAFGVSDGTGEQLVVVMQDYLNDATLREEYTQRFLAKINQALGVMAKLIWVVPGQIVLTSVGKLARAEMRKSYLEGTLVVSE